MDFFFGLPADAQGRTRILDIVDRFSNMAHLPPVAASITAEDTADLFVDMVFKHHDMPATIVSDHGPRFTATFWSRLFEIIGTRLMMSTTAHPEMDGQTERDNRMLEEVLCSYAKYFSSWSEFLPMTEFGVKQRCSRFDWDTECLGATSALEKDITRLATCGANAFQVTAISPPASADQSPSGVRPSDSTVIDKFVIHRQFVVRFVRDDIAAAVDKQKESADQRGRKNFENFKVGDLILLSTTSITDASVTNFGTPKLAPRHIGPFKVIKVNGDSYELDIP
ncbi:unnamed protein product [Peronospora farinosa]|uniref:Integrase catalytic domain-containing protein n=1 Tax=Peronospora farinosa TaxID=134698 RepID=A0AAV0T4M1_9STRA|nr:unnamed protein product [Peronospora farinosa]